MMQVKIIETGEVKTLKLIGPNSGVDFVQDFVGNGGGFENKDFAYNYDKDVYEATSQAFDWWHQVISDQQELVERIEELKEEHGSEAVYEVLESIKGHDLEDDAAVTNAALDEAFAEEEIEITRKEIFADKLESTGDFWRVCQDLVNEGWRYENFEDAGVISDFYSFTDSTFEENLTYLRNLLIAPRHRNISGFFEALKNTLKDASVLESETGRKAWVKDFEEATATTGSDHYEIPGRLTKSGNPEIYSFTREWFTAGVGEEDYLFIH